MKMWMSFIFVLLILDTQSGHAVVLNRNQLASWYPNYLTDYQFNLNSRQITSISTGTFTGLSQLQVLWLNNNNLISLDRNIFIGLLNLEIVNLRSNPISILQLSYVKQLCSTNPRCTIIYV